MVIRVVEIIAIVVFLVGGFGWVLWEFMIKPNEKKQQKEDKQFDLAFLDAMRDYTQIRQSWLDLAIGDKPESFNSHMNDMSIDEVRKFQKHMVMMNAEYGKLTTGRPDEIFVQKAVLLRELFDDAVLKTNQIEK